MGLRPKSISLEPSIPVFKISVITTTVRGILQPDQNEFLPFQILIMGCSKVRKAFRYSLLLLWFASSAQLKRGIRGKNNTSRAMVTILIFDLAIFPRSGLPNARREGRGGGVLDQILDGDVPSKLQKHTRSLYQFFQNVYPTLYQ